MPTNPDLPHQIAAAMLAAYDRCWERGDIRGPGPCIADAIRDYVEAAEMMHGATSNPIAYRRMARSQYEAARDALIAAGKERA